MKGVFLEPDSWIQRQPRGTPRWRRDSIAVILFAIALAAIFLPLHLQGRSACSLPLEHDVGFQWIPFKEFQARSLAQGYFPLWTPRVFAGMPFLAFSHTGALYPWGWMLLAGEYARAVNLFYPLHLLIAGCGLYFLFHRLRNSRVAAGLAAAGVIFTGHFFHFIHFLPSACTIAWSPWLMLAILELSRTGKFRWLALLAGSLGLQILGGDVESAVYGLGFFLILLLLLRFSDPECPELRPLALAVGLTLALILALAQFLPLEEYSHHFIRAPGETFGYYRQRVLSPDLAAALFWPFTKVRGFPSVLMDAPYLYLGLIPLFFAPLAVFGKARPSSRPLALLTLAALAFAFGSLEFLDRILYHLPLINKFGAPEHAFYLFQIFLGLLAGQGLDYFLRLELKAKRITFILFLGLALILLGLGHLRLIFFPGVLLVLIGLVPALLIAVFSPLRAPEAGLALALIFAFDTYAWAYRYLPRNDPKIFQAPPGLKNRTADHTGRYQFVTRQGLNDPLLLHHLGFRLGFDTLDGWITVPPLRFAEFMNRIDPRAASFENGQLAHLGLNVDLRDGKFVDAKSLPLLDLLNLRYILDRQLPLKFASPAYLASNDPERWLRARPLYPRPEAPENTSTSTLKLFPPEQISYRLYVNPGDMLALWSDAGPALAVVTLGQASRSHLLFARGGRSTSLKIPLDPWNGQEMSLILKAVPFSEKENSPLRIWPSIRNPLWAFQQTVPVPIGNDYDLKGIEIYKNQEALPRAFIAHEVEVISEDQKLLDRLAAMPRDHLRQTLLFSKSSPGTDTLRRLSGSAFGQPPSPVDQTENFPDRKSYRVLAVRPGYLFVSDQYLPGWRAWVDGKEWRVEQADYCFRAVFLDAGPHQVTFGYQPLSFRVGLWGSLASFCLLMVAGFYAITAGKRFSKLTA